jgi:hypothetical protein
MDKSQTFAAYVYMRVRATTLSREIDGRRETVFVSELPPETLRLVTFSIAVDRLEPTVLC